MSADHPDELLHRYLVLRYPSVEAAKAAVGYLGKRPGVVSAGIDWKLEFLWAPNDPYFPINAVSAGRYQWGMHAMNFPSAWDRTKGHGYVAAIDGGLPNNQPHADLVANYRSQFSFETTPNLNGFHGSHVLGIIGATANNSVGVAGGCPNCSVAMVRWSGTTSESASGVYGLIERGIQVVNMSFGNSGVSCSSSEMTSLCNAIASADSRDILLVAAAGNNASNTTPQFPASHGSVLAVGGVENTNVTIPGQWIGGNTVMILRME